MKIIVAAQKNYEPLDMTVWMTLGLLCAKNTNKMTRQRELKFADDYREISKLLPNSQGERKGRKGEVQITPLFLCLFALATIISTNLMNSDMHRVRVTHDLVRVFLQMIPIKRSVNCAMRII